MNLPFYFLKSFKVCPRPATNLTDYFFDVIYDHRRFGMAESFECVECGKVFQTKGVRTDHEGKHKISTIMGSPHVALISLPDGCMPGSHVAARYFAEAIAELRKRFPQGNYQFIVFDHEKKEFGGVNAWLAVRS